MMKLTHVLVAGTAVFSAAAFAGGNQQRSEMDQQQSQDQAQSPQSQASQSPEVVKQAQEKLSASGHDAGPADGRIGPQTQQALKDFQSAKGLEASGRLDNQTLAALEIVLVPGAASTGASSSN